MNIVDVRKFISGVVIATILLVSTNAFSQRVIVCTTTMSAMREAVRVSLHSVDMDLQKSQSVPEILPGVSLIGPLLLGRGGRTAIASSGSFWSGTKLRAEDTLTNTSAYNAIPLCPMPTEPTENSFPGNILSRPGWRQFAGSVIRGPLSYGSCLVLLGTRVDEKGLWQGRVDLIGPGTPDGGMNSWEFIGIPIKVKMISSGKKLAILCRGHLSTGAILYIIDIITGEISKDGLELLEDEALSVEAVDIAVSRNRRNLLVLTSGYSFDSPGGEESSWLYQFEINNISAGSKSLRLRGAAKSEDAPIQNGRNGNFWIATHVSGTANAFVNKVKTIDNAPVLEAEIPLPGVVNSIKVRPLIKEGDVAVAMDNSLEIWKDGNHMSGHRVKYEAPISVLNWRRQVLLLGEGPRIHTVNTLTGEPEKTVVFEHGIVTEAAIISEGLISSSDPDADGLSTLEETGIGTSPFSSDSDGDNIVDGCDPLPLVPSPKLHLPAAITFREEAAGSEIHSFNINPPFSYDYDWVIKYDKEKIPWLIISPTSGSMPETVYMGINPARFVASPEVVREVIYVQPISLKPKRQRYGNPVLVEIRVLPTRSKVRRILWIWGQRKDESLRSSSDPHKMSAMADLLAAPPHYFAHHETAETFVKYLDSYNIVVIEASAAMRGALTRSDIQKYIANGGSVLFMGESMQGQDSSTFDHWFTPMGLNMNSNVNLDAKLSSNSSEWICRNWKSFSIENGYPVHVDEKEKILVGIPGDESRAAFTAVKYGQGRMAFIASSSPLQSNAMGSSDNKMFAADLFYWLAQARNEIYDMDSDGIPDDIEDQERLNIMDSGETSFLNPDTDGDGIPDGKEDINLNGVVDEGETNPLNPDSDSDGVFDGADMWPLPNAGTPHVERISPNEGPAEGGTLVLISGRNFTNNTNIWFDNRIVSDVISRSETEILVETPWCASEKGGLCDVKAVNPSTNLESVMSEAFTYRPRAVVNLVFNTMKVIKTQAGIYESALSVIMDCPPDINIGKARFFLKAEPGDSFNWGEPRLMNDIRLLDTQVVSRKSRQGSIRIDVTAEKTPLKIGEIMIIPWTVKPESKEQNSFTISVERSWVSPFKGRAIKVEAEDTTLYLERPKPRRVNK